MPAITTSTKLSTIDPAPCLAPPRAPLTFSTDVFVEGLGVVRLGDNYIPHACGVIPHAAVLASGSPTIFVNNQPVGRISDLISCGSLVAEGASTVFAEDDSDIIQGVTILQDQNSEKNVNKLANGYKVWSGTTVVYIEPGVGFQGVDDEFETNDSYTDLYPPVAQTSPPGPIDSGDIESSVDPSGPPPSTPPITDCSSIALPLDYNILLSPNFQLKQLSISAVFPHTIKAQHGLTQQDIVCNLKALCENVLEPLWAQFNGFRINSSFRSPAATSHHTFGYAADLQWSNFSRDDYFAAAQWVSENLQITQILLEYSSTSGSLWLHVSYNANEIRAPGHPRRVMTMYRNNYTSGLHKINGYS